MTLTLTGYRARPSPSPGTYACERCGITRPYRPGRGRLCRDCRDTDPRWETAYTESQETPWHASA